MLAEVSEMAQSDGEVFWTRLGLLIGLGLLLVAIGVAIGIAWPKAARRGAVPDDRIDLVSAVATSHSRLLKFLSSNSDLVTHTALRRSAFSLERAVAIRLGRLEGWLDSHAIGRGDSLAVSAPPPVDGRRGPAFDRAFLDILGDELDRALDDAEVAVEHAPPGALGLLDTVIAQVEAEMETVNDLQSRV
jgi:hypothetical protein